MRSANIGALPVGENDRMIGIVTDRDIVVRAVADDRPVTRQREMSCKSPSITASKMTTWRRRLS
jgi:CBS domain-containing protein